MSTTSSPLRYPGGKSSIIEMVSTIIKANKLERGSYVEPYAGGCGLALNLMFKGYVHEIHVNDIDRSIWAFWDAVLNNHKEFIEKIKNTPVTLDEWRKQREIWEEKECSDFDLGFSAFYLNRTNRSGIICKAGVIGGVAQDGPYKIDCRFNKETLISKIERINKYRHRIHLSNLDAVEFIRESDKYLPENSFYCIDPPYYDKGSTLYTNFYEHDDHKDLSNEIKGLERSWILTYDNVPEIRRLYRGRRIYTFDINYVAAKKRVGSEILVAGKWVKIPNSLDVKKVA
ncbi:DNA adenine methylase [Marinimicrobium sp. ARAG 43.8]|uniref:DNA adenine methylase n=1 Tax=Marinimicrobium sp. ARAG 43.8 TaxID=3418719 RepID=UPI003CEA1CA4